MTWLFIYLNSLALRRKMASVIWILSVVLYADFMCAVSADKLVSLDCQDGNHGVHGKDSLLRCFLNSGGKSVTVISATWRRSGEERPLIMFKNDKVRMPEDPRFAFKQLQMSGSNIDVSFLVRNTLRTDEGKYVCEVVTDSGDAKAVVSLSVTGLFSLDCQDENHGVHGKDSLLRCFLNSGGKSVRVISKTWRWPGGKLPLIMFINDEFIVREDRRFSFKELQIFGSNIVVPSLYRNTLWTDEGNYECEVLTDSGEAKAVVSLSVTGLLFLVCPYEDHGVHGRYSLLTCFLNSGEESMLVRVDTRMWPGEWGPFMFIDDEVSVREDPRFSFKQLQRSGSNIDLSFLVRNTLWTDEGKYECQVLTDSGYAKAVASLNVTAVLSLDCQDENHGVHGKDSLLKCFLNSGGKSVTVISAAWRRPGGKRPLIMSKNGQVRVPEDPRFPFQQLRRSGRKLDMSFLVRNTVRTDEDPRFSFKQLQMSGSNIDVSFLVRNTFWTDEGKYECEVLTDSGHAKAVVSLSVTATYSKPDMSSVPKKDLQEGMEVTLFCNASGGYPVGMIHWYDQNGTDRTPSAVMTVVETTDKRTNLSSKFTLKASSITPQYRCLVLNSNGVEEGKAEFALKFQEKDAVQACKEGVMDDQGSTGSTAVIVLAIVIIGSLPCGLVILALLYRQRTQRAMYPEGSDMKEEGFLKKGVQAMQWITISSCSTSSADLNKSRSMDIMQTF